MLQQPTKIEFYKSAFCPRCIVVDRALARLEEEFPDLELINLHFSQGLSRETVKWCGYKARYRKHSQAYCTYVENVFGAATQ